MNNVHAFGAVSD